MDEEKISQPSPPVLETADQGWLEKQKPTLVERAEEFLERNKIYSPKPGAPRRPLVNGSQIRNLLAAAQSGSPVAILVNFLRYQIGRKDRGWGDANSGEALLQIFDDGKANAARPPAAGAAGETKKSLAALCREHAGADQGLLYRLEAQVAAQFLGFLIREYTYRCKIAGTSPS